jgi:hypothetical protein
MLADVDVMAFTSAISIEKLVIAMNDRLGGWPTKANFAVPQGTGIVLPRRRKGHQAELAGTHAPRMS